MLADQFWYVIPHMPINHRDTHRAILIGWVALSVCVGLSTASRLRLSILGSLLAVVLAAMALVVVGVIGGAIGRLILFWHERR